MSEPKIEVLSGALARLDLGPEDIAVLMFPDRLTMEQIEEVHRIWEAAFTGPRPAPRVFVLEGGAQIGVLHREPGA